MAEKRKKIYEKVTTNDRPDSQTNDRLDNKTTDRLMNQTTDRLMNQTNDRPMHRTNGLLNNRQTNKFFIVGSSNKVVFLIDRVTSS